MTLAPADLARTAAALGRAFPDLDAVAPLRVLGEGYSSLAVETAGGAVFRIPRIPTAADGYRMEARILPRLAPRLPVAVPAPRWLAEPSADFPHGVAGYPKLPGTPLHPRLLRPDDAGPLEGDIGRLLAALHRFPLDEARALGVGGGADPCAGYTEPLRDAVLPPLRGLLSADEHRTVVAWWDGFLADGRLRAFTPLLIHGDLWFENLLVDEERRLIGVVDWEDTAPGDPAVDLAAQLYLGVDFTRRVLEAYRAAGGAADADLVYRMERLWEVWEFGGIRYAAQYDDAEVMEDSLRKVRAGPVLNPRAAVRLG